MGHLRWFKAVKRECGNTSTEEPAAERPWRCGRTWSSWRAPKSRSRRWAAILNFLNHPWPRELPDEEVRRLPRALATACGCRATPALLDIQ